MYQENSSLAVGITKLFIISFEPPLNIFNQDPVCLLKNSYFLKMNSEKVNYFLIFCSVMENKLENTF
jgi:hypothetical protein